MRNIAHERSRKDWDPDRSLMLAVLNDAISCYRGTRKRTRLSAALLSREAEFWFMADDWGSPFSFNNICSALDLDPEATRARIVQGEVGSELAA
jgi:hypothetical protein